MNAATRRHASTIALAAVLVLASVLVGIRLLGRASRSATSTIVRPTVLFDQTLNHIRRYAVDSLSESDLLRLAASGLVEELDDEFADILASGSVQTVPSDVGGLGLQLTGRGGGFRLLSVLPDSPAAAGGLEPGDQVIDVEGQSTGGMRRAGTLLALHGEPGTAVRLRIRRRSNGQIADVELTRSTPRDRLVGPPGLLEGGIWRLDVPLLGPGAAADLARAILRVSRQPVTGIILDLRGSAGGDLQEAVRVVSLFLEGGQAVATVEGRDGVVQTLRSDGRPAYRGPLAVLVDGTTADAAELVAGALQDLDRALVVGRPTFGRGVTPEDLRLDDGTVVRLSTAVWATPSGRRLQPNGPGFEPDSLAGRPSFRSGAGRDLLGGGGVVPDSVSDDALGLAARLMRGASSPDDLLGLPGGLTLSERRPEPPGAPGR